MKIPKRSIGVWLLAALLAAAVLLEASARVVWRPDALVYQESENPSLQFELKPDAHGVKVGAYTEISRQGLRDREIPDEKQPGEYRLLMLGDHSTFGLGVPLDQTYVRRVPALLNAPAIGEPATVNLSMYHYNLGQKLELLRARGFAFQPDYLVVQVRATDGKGLKPTKYPWRRLKNFLRSRSAAARFVMEQAYWHRKPSPARPGKGEGDSLEPQLAALRDIVRDRKIPVLVVYVPDPSAEAAGGGEEDRTMEERFKTLCAAKELPFYSAREVFQFHKPETLLLDPGTPFLNAAGHRALAEGVGRVIVKSLARGPFLKTKKSARSVER